MPDRRSFFTVTRVALILWVTTMALLVFIPSRVWHYPDDIWLRIVVMIPAMISLGLFFFNTGRQAIRDWKHFRALPARWQNVEEDALVDEPPKQPRSE